MSRGTLFACRLAGLCVLVGAVAGAPVALSEREKEVGPPTLLWKSYPLAPAVKGTPNAKAQPRAATPPDPRPKPFTPPARSPKIATPSPKIATPEPRTKTAQPAPGRQAVSYRISTDQSGFPRSLLLAAFLAGLLVVGTVLLAARKLVPLRDRRRRLAAERVPDAELLEALQPKRRPEPVAAPVGAETVHTIRTRIRRRNKRTGHEPGPSRESPPGPLFREQSGVSHCEIKLWRGFVKCHLYAAPVGSGDEPIADPIAFSPYFRLTEDDRSSSEALEALAALVAALEQDGWTVVSDGPAWYQHSLERTERP
jgi:hypothetical protein